MGREETPNFDPDDLARSATAAASSERAHDSGDQMAAANVINGFARATGSRGRETTNAWAPNPRRTAPHWIELAWPSPAEMNMVHVSFQTVDAALRGEWVASTWAGPFVGFDYLHDNNSGKGRKLIRFRMDRVPPGRYEARLAYREFKNRASNTPVRIVSQEGAKTVLVDQRRPRVRGGCCQHPRKATEA